MRASVVVLVLLTWSWTARADEPREGVAAVVGLSVIRHQMENDSSPGGELSAGLGYAVGHVELSLQAHLSVSITTSGPSGFAAGPALKLWAADRLWLEGHADLGTEQFFCADVGCDFERMRRLGARLGFASAGLHHAITVGLMYVWDEESFRNHFTLSLGYQYEAYLQP